MAIELRHKEYFRRRLDDNSIDTFSSVSDAQTKCAFHSTFLTNSNPTITYALADSNQTLVVTFEFASGIDQASWKTAVTNLSDSSTAWRAGDIEWFKLEWIGPDGTTVAKTETFE